MSAPVWECFRDMAYYDMWAVRPLLDKRFQSAFHVSSQVEAESLCSTLNALEAENAKLRAEIAKDQWISVEERLPDEFQSVLTIWAGQVQRVAYRLVDKDWVPSGDSDSAPLETFTHWRPLPSPPSESNAQGELDKFLDNMNPVPLAAGLDSVTAIRKLRDATKSGQPEG